MAIYNGRILMRKGNEADFDPSKLMSGEWAVSLDAGIVRICLEAGKVIRMATYEAFEEDMKQIEAILLECQSIEEAVRRINTEVTEKLNACAEYVQQAKGYSEQAKTSEANAKSYMQSAKTSEENAKVSETNAKASENSAKEYENSAKLTEERAREVFESIPEDYSTISNDLYELAIKETASGEEIYVNDSSNLKLREFALYGKAKQNTTSGKNLIPYPYLIDNQKLNGVDFTFDGGVITMKGTAEYPIDITLIKLNLPQGTYKFSGISNGSNATYYMQLNNPWERFYDGEKNVTFDGVNPRNMLLSITKGVTVDTTIYPMISVEGGEYEPFTNGASPNPQYPQPIEVSGESGSVEVKSYGKNIANCKCADGSSNYHTLVKNGEKVNLIKGEKYTISVDLEVTSATRAYWNSASGIYSQSSFDINVGKNRYYLTFTAKDAILKENATLLTKTARSDDVLIKVSNCQLEYGDLTEYEPYKETLVTIPTPNGLAGIKVSSNGNYTDSNGQQWICDEIVKYADGSGEYIQRIWKEVFDGSEDKVWKLDSGATIGNRYLYHHTSKMLRSDLTNGVKSLNSNFGLAKNGETYEKTNCYTVSPDSIMVSLNGTETLQEFKEYLASKPMTVLTALETPIETPLTAEEIAEIEKLHTFYPVTNISNDFDCGMSVTYYADSKNYISNQLAIMKQEQEEAMANILSLMPTEVQAMMIENDTNDLLKESEI